MAKFVVITYQRTGSTLLIRSLESKGGRIAGEIFHDGGGVYNDKYRFKCVEFKKRSRLYSLIYFLFASINYRRHLKWYYSGHFSGSVGFKLMLSQMKFLPGIIGFLKNQDVLPIFLTRNNVFECSLSQITAKKTKVYHTWNNMGDEVVKSRISGEKLERRMIKNNYLNKYLTALSKEFENSLVLDYSELTDIQLVNDKIRHYLKDESLIFNPKVKKLADDNRYKQLYSNYDEVLEKYNSF